MELIELLKQSMLFSGLNDPDLAELATITVRRKFKKGESLFGEGDDATGFYLLVSGSIKLCRIAHDGREKVLHFVRPGETFAEAAFFGDGKYPAEARAMEAGEVLYLPREGFLELMGRNPGFSLNLVVSLSLMLRRFARQIEELSFADVTSGWLRSWSVGPRRNPPVSAASPMSTWGSRRVRSPRVWAPPVRPSPAPSRN